METEPRPYHVGPISRRTAIKTAIAAGSVIYAQPFIDTLPGAHSAQAMSVPPGCHAGDKVTLSNGTVATTCCGPNDCPGPSTTAFPCQCYVLLENNTKSFCASFTTQPCTSTAQCPPGTFCAGATCVAVC